jgi:type II secretory pathway component GspD/PulD (secretin)
MPFRIGTPPWTLRPGLRGRGHGKNLHRRSAIGATIRGMNAHPLQRWALAFFSVCLMAAASWAQSSGGQTLEVVKLKYRPAEEVIPALRPLLEPGGALSADGFNLFVRTSPGNLAQLRQALAQLDRRPIQYLIAVRNSTRQEIDREQLAAAAAVGNNGVRATVRATDGSARQQGTNVSSVTVLEDNEAFIATGQNPSGQSGFQNQNNGFTVIPRSLGEDRVRLEINQRSRQRNVSGRIENQSLTTQVSGKLGEWIELGGLSGSVSSTRSGILSRGYATSSDERSVWVKVDSVPENRPGPR